LTDETRQLLSIDFIAGGTSTREPRMNIFGATAVSSAVAVPEPGTIALVLIGFIGLFCRKRKVA
jgi:hypothetical protein